MARFDSSYHTVVSLDLRRESIQDLAEVTCRDVFQDVVTGVWAVQTSIRITDGVCTPTQV
jgi:hypothetical protein